MTPEQLRKQADKVVALSQRMEEVFPFGYSDEHLLVCIMAGLHDAFCQGVLKSQEEKL